MLRDILVVHGQSYSGSTGPVVVKQTVRSLVFQMNLVEKSWSMHTDGTTPAPTDHMTLSTFPPWMW